VERFRARFELKAGDCTFFRAVKGGAHGKELQRATATRLRQQGSYRLRFANVDERLTLWVDGDMPFADGVAYDPPGQRGPTENDLQPASIGAKGAGLKVAHLVLRRNTYYTVGGPSPDVALPEDAWSDPAQWDRLRDLPARTMHVHPSHYLGLGDNSSESSDSRDWGLVPEKNVIGPAVLIYYPFARAGRLR
jgi:signal peptidase I